MSGSQKFLSRNRAPRVQIEYDVEVYGAQKKVQLPFVMGVMSDLSGKSEVPKGSVTERKFLEIDIDNFDQRMKAMKPRAAFSVPNTLSGEGNLSVDLVFEKMSDFSPAEIARKVEPLRKLLEARTQLENLMTYMDGKAGAEELIERLVGNPDQLRALAFGAGAADEQKAAFDAMKAAAPEEAAAPKDTSRDILAAVALDAPEAEAPNTGVEDTLAALANAAQEPDAEVEPSADILADMAASSIDEAGPEADTQADILAGLAADAPENTPDEDAHESVLADMAKEAPESTETDTSVEDALAGMAATGSDETPAPDESADILADMAMAAPEDTPDDTTTEDALAGLAAGVVPDEPVDNGVDDLLADMAEAAPEDAVSEDPLNDILVGLAENAIEDVPEENGVDDTLAGLALSVDAEEDVQDESVDVLADMAMAHPEDAAEDTSTADALAGLAASAVVEETVEDGVEDLLADMAEAEPDDEEDDDQSANILADLAEGALDEVEESDGVETLLSDMAVEAPLDELEADVSDDILADLANGGEEAEPESEGADDLLAEMAAEAPDELEDDGAGLEDLLADMADMTPDVEPIDDDSGDIFAEIAATEADEPDENEGLEDLLADMAEDVPEEEADDGLDDLLGSIAEDAFDEDDEGDSDLDDLLAGVADVRSDDADEDDGLDDLLAAVATDTEEDSAEEDGIEDLLADMADEVPEDEVDDGLDDLLGSMAEDAPDEDDEDEADLDDLLADMADEVPDDDSDELDIDDLLADVAQDPDGADEDELDLDDLLAGVSDEAETDLDALLSGDDNEDDDLDALLSGVDDDDDLDALLADTDDDDDLDDLLADDDSDDLDDLLADDALEDLEIDDIEDTPAAPPPKPKKPAFKPDFGSMSAAKLQHEAGSRRKFRIAVLGDFSGRGNNGNLEIGEALGKRKAFKLDFDTMEDVIMRFRTTLTLPLGNDGSAVEVELNELDDLHPDELFENVELFNELNMLRRDLSSGRNFEQNVERMKAWGGEFGDFKALSRKRSKGADAPADLRLTDFQNLIGDSEPKPEASAASDLISRIIGPHIVAAADNGAEAMIAAVDAALSTAMSSVLHHPDFQSIEAAWRSIELLGRRVETSAELEVVVYDVSVEEFTADLAAQDDVSQSGLYEMLVEKPMQDESGGPISAVIGLYTWEETPTHAELLARMARISAQMEAPFISAISTGFMGVKPEDRHPLVQKTWNALGEMPEAKYLGLASPRFMLRMPYGKKTEPLDRFDYEEFNVKEGMRSMLMANPALLVAVLLAETKARQGGDMSLGSIMSLNDMPFHFMTDQYGDQVALPCTERLLSVSGAADVVARGFMPVLSVQGQNIVKLASFQAVGGGELLGIWSGDAAKEMKSGRARMETSVGISSGAKQTGAPPKVAAKADSGGDDSGYGFDSDLGADDDDLDLDLDLGDDDDDGLDDLLAGFGDDDDDDDDDMDADLAALLGDL